LPWRGAWSISVTDGIILAIAALLGGGINAVAGAGTLITFPAMIAIGYDSKVANVTNKIALWPGSVSTVVAYRPELSANSDTVKRLVPAMVIGGLIGSILLLATPTDVFDVIVPFLILGSCALLAFQAKITAWALKDKNPDAKLLNLGVVLVSAYGGYFGGGLGIVSLALFAIFLSEDLQVSNAIKGFLQMTVNGVAAVYFVIFGDVAWEAAVLMMVFSLAGGYYGARIARKLPRKQLLFAAVGYGTLAGLYLLARLWI
jgi:uncharacterized membrane protein YfcA